MKKYKKIICFDIDNTICSTIGNKYNKSKPKITVIKNLINNLNIKNYSNQNFEGKFSDKRLMFTGGFQNMSRSEAKAIAEKNGGKVLGSISKKLDILVVGDSKPTRKKIEKAKDLKVQILKEKDWYKILNI